MSGAYSGLGVGGAAQLHRARGSHSLSRGVGGGGVGAGGGGGGGAGDGRAGGGGMLNSHDGYAQVMAAASAAGLGGGGGGGIGSDSFTGMLMGDGSMIGANGLLNGLDMDMSLPMDMDLDLSQAGGADAAFVMPGQTQAQQQQLADALMAASSGDGGPTTSSAPPPDSNMTGIGAGPLPTGFGMPAPQSGTTLTEFTKRRNWSQRIIEELKDFLHILTPDGRILYVSPSCKAITGYETRDLVGKFIGEYVHPDDSGIFMREFNESIASGHSLRFFYRFKKEDGTYMIFECDGHPHISPEPSMSLQGYNASPEHGNQPGGLCKGFFMMARPYPTKNAALLDSFLEHKIENERLMKKIAELKREEQQENAEQERLYQEQAASQASASPLETQVPSRDNTTTSEAPASTPNYQGMPPPARPPVSNTALTRQNLDSALSAQKPDSIADKMSRYEANSTHLESIELLTGLRYRDGERSHGISTGDTSPALIRGDAGIAILLDRDREGSKKEKKKLKVADEYVCADCGTLDSPEWRKGPKGPKTLCNACGLRWAKKEKKRSSDDVRTSDSGGIGTQTPLTPGHQMSSTIGNGNGGSLPHMPGLPMQNSSGSS